MNEQEFALLLSMLAVATGKELDTPTVEVYYHDLHEMSDKRLRWTLEKARTAFDMWPSVGMLIRLSREYPAEPLRALPLPGREKIPLTKLPPELKEALRKIMEK